MSLSESRVAVIGLGYVGLPLAIAFGRNQRTIGFDLDESRLARYRQASDPNGGISAAEFSAASHLEFSSDPTALAQADVILVAVPTPIDDAHRPDLSPLENACRTVGAHLRPGSTVYVQMSGWDPGDLEPLRGASGMATLTATIERPEVAGGCSSVPWGMGTWLSLAALVATQRRER